jgi:aminopeptidase N
MSESSVSTHRTQDRIVCRHMHQDVGKWTLREESPKYAPDRTCDIEHLKLELAIDLPARRLEAVCTQRLRAAYGPFDRIVLDAVDLRIRSVRDGSGRDLESVSLDRKLTVRFPEPVADTAELRIEYDVDHPALGLYFTGPNDAEPHATWQLWSQGEDEEARYWIPCHDAPNERMTTEMIVTTDARYTVISNGELRGVSERAGKKTWHWFESVPHVSYLITLVVGEFVQVVHRDKGLLIDSYVEPGREEEAQRSFGRTPDMVDFFARLLECPYPYEKYTQVAIRHFHFGGMENTSATSQTDGTLHDERAALDFTSDELVAHELAHQWFGDLLTCKSWAHAWLNEGFATYFEALWKEEDRGREEFDYEMIANSASYRAEGYRRAIVSNRYAYPQDLFDMHLYPKGAWVLHMLRRKLGDEIFWKALRLYVRRHRCGCVETIDLIRAFEDASGKNLTGFFDQWIMSPGHPEIEGAIAWEADEKRVRVSLKQAHKAEGGIPAVFRIPVRVECRMRSAGGAGGAGIKVETFEMDQQEQTFYVATGEKPLSVVVDPEQAVLGTWKLDVPTEWLEALLLGPTRDPRVYARVLAVRRLGEKPSYKDESTLERVLIEDPFWGVQAEAARALGNLRTPHALEILVGAMGVEHPKARVAVVGALGSFASPTAAEALRQIVQQGDPSWFVEAAASASLGRTRQPGVETVLRDALHKPSWHDLIATHAVLGLAATRDESAVDDILAVGADRKRYWNCRLTALRALAELGAARPALAPRIAEEIARFLDDPSILVATRAAGAVVSLGHESGVAALRRAALATSDPRQAQSYLMAADELASQRKRGEDVDRLREELEKLRGEAKEMKEALGKLEEKAAPSKTGAGAKRVSKKSPSRKPTGSRPATSKKGGGKKPSRRARAR